MIDTQLSTPNFETSIQTTHSMYRHVVILGTAGDITRLQRKQIGVGEGLAITLQHVGAIGVGGLEGVPRR